MAQTGTQVLFKKYHWSVSGGRGTDVVNPETAHGYCIRWYFLLMNLSPNYSSVLKIMGVKRCEKQNLMISYNGSLWENISVSLPNDLSLLPRLSVRALRNSFVL